jgi:hypothetical protein
MKKNILFGAMLILALNVFSQRIDMSLIPYRVGDKWGYASPEKNIVIAPKYSEAGWFSEGLASVKIGSKYGYINTAGKLVIPAKFTVAKSFRKGYLPNEKTNGGDSVIFAGASLQANGYEICINNKGARMGKCPAINENSVAENNVPLTVKEKTYSLANNNGMFDKIIDDYKVSGSDETYYIAQKGGMYGVFNSKFDTIVPFQFSAIRHVNASGNEYLEVKKGTMNGVMSGNGKMLIDPAYSNLVFVNAPGSNGYVIIQKEGKTYVKDLQNNDIISTGYSDIVYDNEGGFVITGDNNLRGFYFMDNTMIQPKYKDVKMMNGGHYLMVKTNDGKNGYISAKGDEYFKE